MKILRITLRNLASLAGQHTVDFTREPLRTAGLFSISGPTGSGKSTLLDALCLALYDDTPRLRGIGRLAELANGEKQNDPRNLLRRGTSEGLAEVAFRGLDGQSYTARWVVRRAHGRADGALQQTELALFRGDVLAPANGETISAGKKTEVLAAIADRIGLSFAQFTRAVLLAQNDFATFLKAEDRERAEILQALTGTGRFEEISIAVFERYAAEQRAVENLKAQLLGNAPLSPEARAQAETAVTLAEAELKVAADKLTAREFHVGWFAQQQVLSKTLQEAGHQLAEAARASEAAAPRRLDLVHTERAAREAHSLWEAEQRTIADLVSAEKARTEAAQAEAHVRADHDAQKNQDDKAAQALNAAKAALEAAQPRLREARHLDAKLTPLAERLALAIREREAAEASVRDGVQRRDELQRLRESAEREQARLTTERTVLAPIALVAPEATAWLDRLGRAAAAQKACQEAKTVLAEKAKQERDKEAAVTAERAKEPEIRQLSAAAAAAWEKADAVARTQDGEKIAAARRSAETNRGALLALRDHLQRDELQTEMVKIRADNEADSASLTALTAQRIPAARSALEAARHAFELAQAAVADAAIGLREKLAPQHPCPVCGALDHPYAAHPPDREGAALRALRDDCTAKEKEGEVLREQAARLVASGEARVKRLSELQRAVESLPPHEALPADRPAVVDLLALPPADRWSALNERIAAQAETLTALESADQSRRDAEREREFCLSRREAAAAQLAELEKKLATLASEFAAQRVARETAGEIVARAEKHLGECRVELAPLWQSIADGEAEWERAPVAFHERFAQQTNAFLQLEKRSAELVAQVREFDAALAPVRQSLAVAEAAQKTKRADEAKAKEDHEAWRVARAAVFEGRAADAVEGELVEAVRLAAESRERSADALGKAREKLATSAEALRSAGVSCTAAIDRRTAASAALDGWLAAFSEREGRGLARADLEKMLGRDAAWIARERTALETLEGAVRKAEGAVAAHRKTLEEHLATRPTLEEEAVVLADVAELRDAQRHLAERCDSARLVVKADDRRMADNAALNLQIQGRQVAAEPWLKLNELIGSADGAKFRGIAQRRTLDLLLDYANAQLDQLAARYHLERLPQSLNLIVLDRDMGDERRSVHSLSGGESFLVSLALALALASLTSNRLRIESLFIDEGFGSLDAETLNTAMNALMHLEAQGRKVGVISHVSEMADAIPVQIRLVKGRAGASRLVVPGAVPDEASSNGAGENADPAAVSAQIIAILERARTAGAAKVSSQTLRTEIGCDAAIFKAAQKILGGRIEVVGKSLQLSGSVHD